MQRKLALVLIGSLCFRINSYALKNVIVKSNRATSPPSFSLWVVDYRKEITLINQDDLAILEDVAARFSKPQNRSGHTLSVSDVVAIERKTGTRFYYRDISGWKEIKK